jgi:ABC-2 type transport system ATP-binding protein
MDDSEHPIITRGLTKRFGPTILAVDGLDLELRRGEVYGLLGPNGAGKTTTLRMLLGLARPTAGTALVAGHPPGTPESLARVGALVESPAFWPYLSGRDNLRALAAYLGAGRDRIERVLASVDLAPRAHDRFATYSMGMKQRLGVAAALLKDPEVLVLDEPTNGLDPAGIHEFRAMIRGLVAEGRTVLLSSHLLSEVEKICDEVAIVDRGRVVMQGSIADLARGGQQSVLVATSDDARALGVVSGQRAVDSATPGPDGIHISLSKDVEAQPAADEISRSVVLAGLAIRRFEPVQASLEQRFLEITSRLEDAA